MNATVRQIALFLATMGALAAQTSKEVHRTLPLAADGQVSLDTHKGSVRVSVWDRNEVQMDVRIVEDGGWLAQDLSRADVNVTGGGRDVRMESGWHGAGWLFGSMPSFHYTLRVPKNARLRIRDHKSDIAVDGLAGALDFDTHKGTARLRGLEGGLRLSTHKGDVQVEFARFDQRSSFETHKGNVNIQLPRDAKFTLRQSLDRKAGLRSDFPAMLRTSRQGGNTSTSAVNGGGPDLSLKSHKGSFTLRGR